jgi:alpha-beta hydrolase superfamily lysophospholipase
VTETEIREFTASDGYRLRYRFHGPKGHESPCGFVVALHGIQSHAGWYEHSSRRLAGAGYEINFLDRRGSGLNQTDRGHAPHVDRLVNDVVQVLSAVGHRRDRQAPSASVILSAVSWGGKLAAVICARRPDLVDGLALITPGICARVRPRWDQRLRLRIAGCLGIQRKLVPIPLDNPALFTREARWQEFIRNDSLTLRQAAVSLLQASIRLDEEVVAAAERIGCPTLLMLAGNDQIIDNAATGRWFDRLPPGSRQLIEYPEAQHTLEFEPDRDRFIDDLIGWLNSVSAD